MRRYYKPVTSYRGTQEAALLFNDEDARTAPAALLYLSTRETAEEYYMTVCWVYLYVYMYMLRVKSYVT